MPRNSSKSKSPVRTFSKLSVPKPGSKPSYTPPNTPVSSPNPTPTYSQPPVQYEQPSMWSSVKQGFGWGVGTSIARNIFGGNSETIVKETRVEVPANNKTDKCFNENETFTKCLKEQGSGMCFQQEDLLRKCLEK